MGFKADADFETVVRDYIADEVDRPVEPGDRLLFIRHVTGEDVKHVPADRPRG